MEYNYTNKTTSPNLDSIHADIASSAMTDKVIEYCLWHKKDECLHVVFTNTLSGGDKTLLDTIVSDNS